MKMNMQDYRHAQDRVHIAEHCKEEVLSMAQNQKTNGRPIIRIAAGITAAAACLAVVGTLGHSFFNGKQDGILMPATTSDISAQFEEQGAKSAVTTPAAAKPETDDREFPLLSSMSEDKRTKTFKWGTIKLNSFLVSNFGENDKDAEYIEFQFDVHLNDDIDITEADAFNVEWYCSMYDTAMEHKITQFNPTTLHLQGFDDTHNFRISCDCFIPEEAAACLTKDETGEYREIYSDFLEKQPIPDYLLYELEITDAEIEAVHYDGGNEIKEVLVSEKTPMFKFRPADAPKDEAEIVNVKPGDALGEAADIEEDSTEAMTTAAVSETTVVSSENRNASDSEKLDAANKVAEQFYAAVQAAIEDLKADETLSPYDLENMEKGFEFNEFEISEIRSASKENNPFYYYIAQHLPAQTAFITVAFGVESEKCKYVIVQTADIISSYGDFEQFAIGAAPQGFTADESELILSTLLRPKDRYLISAKSVLFSRDGNSSVIAKHISIALNSALTDMDSEDFKIAECMGEYTFKGSEMKEMMQQDTMMGTMLKRAREYYPKLAEVKELAVVIRAGACRQVAVVTENSQLFGTYPHQATDEESAELNSIEEALQFAARDYHSAAEME